MPRMTVYKDKCIFDCLFRSGPNSLQYQHYSATFMDLNF